MIAQSVATTASPAARSVVASMADFMTAQKAATGSVTRDDLLLEFTVEQIDAHFEAAKKRAQNAGKARQ